MCEKDDYTATFKPCSKDNSVEYIGFGVLKQHSEKKKHGRLACVDPADEGKSKQSMLLQYFVKTPQSTVAKETSSLASHNDVWTVKQ